LSLRGGILGVITAMLAVCALLGCSSGPAATATPTPIVAVPSPAPSDTPVPATTDETSPTPSGPIDLNGLWEDNGHQVRITQAGSDVTGNYVEPHPCDHRDGTGQSSTTDLDFTGTLEGTTITGTVNVCDYGAGNPHGVGFRAVPVTLNVNADASELSGSWYDDLDETDVDITITRIN
jgi:hypothetical protein